VHGGQETGGLLTERYAFVDEVAPTSPETSFFCFWGGGGAGVNTFSGGLRFVSSFELDILQLMVCSSCGRSSEVLTSVMGRICQHRYTFYCEPSWGYGYCIYMRDFRSCYIEDRLHHVTCWITGKLKISVLTYHLFSCLINYAYSCNSVWTRVKFRSLLRQLVI
jgi:hypothetical protein